MKKVVKKISKNQILTVSFLAAAILLFTACLVVGIWIPKINSENNEPSSTIEVGEGEAIYLNNPIAYPYVDVNNITAVEVSNSNGNFGMSRYPEDYSDFMFHYYDIYGDLVMYTPPIYSEDKNFDYTSLYAKTDEYGMLEDYTWRFLCSAIGIPYYSDKIDLSDKDAAVKTALLEEYGFIEQNDDGTYANAYAFVAFSYGERDSKTNNIIDGTEKTHTVRIGKKATSGSGYYFMVDGRETVYYRGDEYLSCALTGFHEFVNGQVVTEGLAGESVYGPYLTSDFKSWTGTTYNKSEEEYGYVGADKISDKTIGTTDIIVTADRYMPIFVDNPESDGYDIKNDSYMFDMRTLSDSIGYELLKNAMINTSVGKNKDMWVTFIDEFFLDSNKQIDFKDQSGVNYEYVITAIESVINKNGELVSGSEDTNDAVYKYTYNEITKGTVGENAEYVKVAYKLSIGGTSAAHEYHALIKLSDLTEDERALFLGENIGKRSSGNEITIVKDYTKENSLSIHEKYVLTSIVYIYDENGAQIDKVTDNSYIYISYYCTIGDVEGKTQMDFFKVSDLKNDKKLSKLYDIVIGQEQGKLRKVIYDTEYNYEVFRGFTSYNIKALDYFVVNEPVVSFKFVNASERDPFYGETFFTNTLEGAFKLYGLNSGSCEGVVKFLGGIGQDSNSAVGLAGTTVAIGLTLENMNKYGLFAHRIYFELPRNITAKDEDDDASSTVSDFDWESTLGFMLYISDVKYDSDGNKIRYIGSDMYDVVVSMPADDFEFLEYDFTEFWARPHMMMMDITNLEELKLDFNMDDLKGEYNFSVYFKDMYYGKQDGETVRKDNDFEGSTPYNTEFIRVSHSDGAFETELSKFINANNVTDDCSLADFYNSIYKSNLGENKLISGDIYYKSSRETLGAAYFNSVYSVLQMTRYQGILEDGVSYDENDYIFKASVKVSGDDQYYTYKFYRIDDRRIAVSLCRTTDGDTKVPWSDEVSDFYISTFAFKQLINSYVSLLNGEKLEYAPGYPVQ